MSKIKGLIAILPKKTLKEALLTLQRMFSEDPLSSRKKDAILAEFKRIKSEFETNLIPTSVLGNKWGEKDAKQILKERNDRVFELEGIVETLKYELANTKTKKVKIEEPPKDIIIRQIIDVNYYEREILELKERLTKNTKESEMERIEHENAMKKLQIESETLSNEIKSINKRVGNDKTYLEFQKLAQEHTETIRELNKCKNVITDFEKKVYDLGCSNKILEEERRRIKAHAGICEMRLKNITFPSENSVLIEELKSISKAFETLQKENKDLIESISLKNKKILSISEKTAENINEARFAERRLKEISKELNILNREKEIFRNEIQKFQSENGSTKEQLEEANAELLKRSCQIKKLESTLSIMKGEVKRYMSAYSNESTRFKNLEMDLQKLKLEIIRLQSQIETYKSAISNKEFLEDLEHLDKIRLVLNCNLCSEAFRNTTILKCGHCYCEGCIDKRIKSRIKGCPACSVDFVKDDLMKIYFPH